MERVWQGTHVYVYFTSYIEYSIARDFTDRFGNTPMLVAKEEFYAFGYGTGFVKGSPYFHRFDNYFQRLTEAGLIKKWTQEVSKRAYKQPRKTKIPDLENKIKGKPVGPAPFSLNHLKAAFYLCSALLILSFVIFIAEILIFKIYEKGEFAVLESFTL